MTPLRVYRPDETVELRLFESDAELEDAETEVGYIPDVVDQSPRMGEEEGPSNVESLGEYFYRTRQESCVTFRFAG